MVDANGIIDLYAGEILDRRGLTGRPSQVLLRRADSGSYYALFHELCRRCADLHVGATRRADPRYTIVYRAVVHAQAERVMQDLAKRSGAADVRVVAEIFVSLQEDRHLAD